GTVRMSSMVFFILVGASFFSLVFRGLGGDETVHAVLSDLPGGTFGALFVVMLSLFLLGFIIDFIEITYVVVPIVGPVLLAMGLDPVWLGVMIALNLQTSFLTPPFGFRSEEHTSELQSRENLVCRLLLEKKMTISV